MRREVDGHNLVSECLGRLHGAALALQLIAEEVDSPGRHSRSFVERWRAKCSNGLQKVFPVAVLCVPCLVLVRAVESECLTA